MSGDYTRFTYDALRDYDQVRAQQGRIVSDADLNEMSDAFDHRLRALALDVLGPCTAPVDQAAAPGATADGFKIEPGGASFTIGLGRLYLHGLQLDNHGSAPFDIEPGLQDLRGRSPVPYESQPYYPNPPAAPTSGEHVVYVDAWDREVTAVSDPTLVDVAIGVDTAARMQTVWQVKVLPDSLPGVTCETPDDKLPGWAQITAPSSARLTVAAVGVPAPTDPCSVPPDGGYRGWDNRLYRVEVHTGGTLAGATFKWSRDNASVETAVADADTTRKTLTVARTGRDDVQRIRENAWVEVLDDEHELDGTAGHLAQVVTVDPVDDMAQTVTLSTAVPAAFGTLGPARRTRLRQWDHSTATSTIKVSDATAGYVLEDGVQISFAEAPAGQFRTGDYWTFAARSTDGSLQPVTDAAPQGPIHFYGRLAVVGGNATQDCRAMWPCECDGGCGDECTECVTPESHATGRLTIQMAVDRAREHGGVVCVAAGRYRLEKPVVVEKARGLTIRGNRWASILEFDGAGPAVAVVGSVGVQLLDLTVLIGAEIEPESNPGDVEEKAGTSAHLGFAMKADVRSARTNWAETNAENEARGTRTRDAKRSATPVAGIALLHCGGVRIEGCVVLDVRLLQGTGTLAGGMLGSRSTAYQSPLASALRVGYGQTAGIVTAGIVAGLAIRDCVLVAAFGSCGWHTLAASLKYSKTHVEMVRSLALGYSLLVGVELTDDIVIGLRAAVWWDDAVLTSAAGFERCMLTGLLGVGLEWDAHPLDSHASVRSCVVSGRWAAIDSSAPGLTVADCRLSASGTGATGAESDRLMTSGDGVLLSAPVVEGALTDVTIRNCSIRAARYGVAAGDDSTDVRVADNRVEAGLGGIVLLPEATGERWVVRGNDVHVSGVGVPREGGATLAGIWLVQVTLGEVRENYVHDLGSDTQQPFVRMGIAVEQCASAVVAANTVVNAVGSGRPSWAIGIGCWPDVGALDVIDNVIVVDRSAAAPPASDPVAFTAIRIDARAEASYRNPRTGELLAAGVRVTKRAMQQEAKASFAGGIPAYVAKVPAEYARVSDQPVRLTPQRVFRIYPGAAPVAIRGNRVDTNGMRPAVVADVEGPLLLTGNVVRHVGADSPVIGVGIAAEADSMVVNANHIVAPAATVSVGFGGAALNLTVDADRVTIIGNVVFPAILLNQAVLGAPWAPLNVTLS